MVKVNNNQASNAQKDYIRDLCRQLEYDPEDYNFDKMTVHSAGQIITKLKAERDDINAHLRAQGRHSECLRKKT